MVAELGRVVVPVEFEVTNGTQAFKDAKVDEALKKIDELYRSGEGNTGGYRVQMREMLAKLFDQGMIAGAWEPKDAPRTTSEALGRPQVARGAAKAPEGPTAGSDEDTWGELRGWWEQTAHDEIGGLVAKMVEYGGARRATDLTEVGQAMVACGVPEGPLLGSGRVQDGWLQELGAYFYLRGKFARWTAAIAEGRPVSDDTLHDIAVYVRMAQRIRAVGGWPV